MDERMDILRKYNLWTEGDFDFGFMRVAYTGRIMDYVGNRLVKVLIGQRRTGKSYVLRQIARELIRNGVPPQNTLFINRELSDFAFLKIHKDLEELVALYKSELHPQGRIYIFIDEVQLIEEKLFGSCFETCDQKEGMNAFLEKRKVDAFLNK